MRRHSTIVRAIAVAAFVLARAPFCLAQVQPPPGDSCLEDAVAIGGGLLIVSGF
jgi:hypothetical protein